MTVASIYLAYDDSALTTYANAGLLRRAQKDVAANKIERIEEGDSVANAEQIVLNSDGQIVILPSTGLTNASCDCSSVSACKHILASVLYVQSLAEFAQGQNAAAENDQATIDSTELKNTELNNDQPNNIESKETIKDGVIGENKATKINDKSLTKANTAIVKTALAEVLAFSLNDLQKFAKTIPKAKRLKVMLMAVNYLEDFGRKVDSSNAADNASNADKSQASVIDEIQSLRIYLPHQSEEIRYILGAGFVGMLSKIERDADSYHWLALVVVQTLYGAEEGIAKIRQWLVEALSENTNSASVSLDRLSAVTLIVLDDIAFDVEQILYQGLSQLERFSANRMHLANTLARSQNLPRLAMQLRQLSGQMHDFIKGDNHIDERQLLIGLAELSAYLYQLQHSDATELPKLRGKLRHTYDADDTRADLRLLPLGARWWFSQGKARGLTLYFYESNENQIVEFTQARAQAQDLSFNKQTAWFNAVWLSTAQNLMNQISTLSNPRFNDNGGLAVTGSKVLDHSSLKDDFAGYLDSVRGLAVEDWQHLQQRWLEQLMSSGTVDGIVVLNPTKIGSLQVDEIEQCVWWSLADQNNNQVRLRLNWNANEQQSIDIIDKLERIDSYLIQMIVAQVNMTENTIEINPMTLIMLDQLFHLDYSQVPTKKNTLKALLTGQISKLVSKKRRLVEIENTKVLTLSQLVCEPILSVLDSLSASGRLQPTEAQIKQLRQQHKLAQDAGLSVLASSIEHFYSRKIKVNDLLQLAYLCKMLLLLEAKMPFSFSHSPQATLKLPVRNQ